LVVSQREFDQRVNAVSVGQLYYAQKQRIAWRSLRKPHGV